MKSESVIYLRRLVVVAILLLHVSLLAYGSWHHSATVDEWGHLPSGVQYWNRGRTDAYRVNPPLVRAIVTIPVAFSPPDINYDVAKSDGFHRSELILALNLLDKYGARSYPYFFYARLMCIPFSIIGALVCYQWASELFGPRSGMFALVLWCLSPTILGFAQVITADVPSASIGLLFCYTLVKWQANPRNSTSVLLGIALGLTLLTKFTWLSLAFSLPLILLVFAIANWSWPSRATWLPWIAKSLCVVAVSILVINCAYSFGGFLDPVEVESCTSKKFKSFLSIPFTKEITSLLPNDYVLGIDRQMLDFEIPTMSYLRGEWRDHGWVYYYVYAMLIKMPLGFWVLFGLSAIAGCFHFRSLSFESIVLFVVPISILVLVSRETGFNAHLRYVLPAFPFLFILATFIVSEQCKWFRQSKVLKTVSFIALAGFVTASLTNYPHSISFFNCLVGGPNNGHLHLLDSNIDYGQDLKSAKRWLDKHNEIKLDGVDVFLPPNLVSETTVSPPSHSPRPGTYLVSIRQMMHYNNRYKYFLDFEYRERFGYSVYLYELTENEVSVFQNRAEPK